MARRPGIVRHRAARAVARACLALALVLFEQPLFADSSRDPAVLLYERSAESYRAGRFREAIDLLQQAYRLRDDPVLLYNLGRAYEGLGDKARAMAAYEQYLARQPRIEDRPAIERRIAVLGNEIAEREELERQKRDALEREEALRRSARSPRAVPWVVAGVGGAVVLAGGVFGLLALDRHGDASEGPQADVGGNQAEARDFAAVANVGFLVGGLLSAAGLTWAVFDVRAAKASP